jgi:hypothetical protein
MVIISYLCKENEIADSGSNTLPYMPNISEMTHYFIIPNLET